MIDSEQVANIAQALPEEMLNITISSHYFHDLQIGV